MTNEQILEIAEKHFDYQGGWLANTEDLLKFALTMYKRGILEGAYQQSKRYMEEVSGDD